MAREYNPEPKKVGFSIKQRTQAGTTFWVARCSKHGDVATATTDSEAAVQFGLHAQKKHRGETIERM